MGLFLPGVGVYLLYLLGAFHILLMVGSPCLLNESKKIQTRVPRKNVDPSFVTARPQGGFPLSRKFYVRVHARKFYSRKENRDEVWTEVLGLRREVELGSIFTFTRARSFKHCLSLTRERKSYTRTT